MTGIVKISGFEGINNCLEPLALDPKWQTDATGLLLDDARFFVNQPGVAPLAPRFVDLYGARGGAGFAVDDTGGLHDLNPIDGLRFRASGFLGAPFAWAELGTAVFALSASHAWAIYPDPDRVVPWGVPPAPVPTVLKAAGSLYAGTYRIACALEHRDGRIGGATFSLAETVDGTQGLSIAIQDPPPGYKVRLYVSARDGDSCRLLGTFATGTVRTLSDVDFALETTVLLDEMIGFPPPSGHLIGRMGNKLAVAVREDDRDETTIYFSRPDNPHVFPLDEDYVTVPGTATVIADFDGGCVIGTDRAIYRYGLDRSVTALAEHGATPGSLAYDHAGRAHFWTPRGLCLAEPFERLTESRFCASPPGLTAAAILPWRGSDYYLCSTKETPERLRDGNRFVHQAPE